MIRHALWPQCMELPEAEVKRVQQLITAGHGGGGASASSFGGKPWLAEIVANWRNGIDGGSQEFWVCSVWSRLMPSMYFPAAAEDRAPFLHLQATSKPRAEPTRCSLACSGQV